jgi:hypothetical protein
MKWTKPEPILLTVIASKCAEVLARLERDVKANGFAHEPWVCQKGIAKGTRAAVLSQGDGVRGICGFGMCVDPTSVPAIFDGRAVNEKLFRFTHFADPTHRVLVSDEETRAIIGKQTRQRSSGCRLDQFIYDKLLAAANAVPLDVA